MPMYKREQDETKSSSKLQADNFLKVPTASTGTAQLALLNTPKCAAVLGSSPNSSVSLEPALLTSSYTSNNNSFRMDNQQEDVAGKPHTGVRAVAKKQSQSGQNLPLLYRLGTDQSFNDLREVNSPTKRERWKHEEARIETDQKRERVESRKKIPTPLPILREERLAVASEQSRYLKQPISIEYCVVKKEPKRASTANKLAAFERYQTRVDSHVLEPLIISNYRILRTIGSGSTAKVKLAVHLQSGALVALKIVPRLWTIRGQRSRESIVSRERRVLREAAILNLTRHPNIVKLLDLIITDDLLCLVFEYVEGMELLDMIVEKHRLSERRSRNYFIQLLDAVAYCHAHGIVHRDLKIENILVPANGNNAMALNSYRIVLVDFGLANLYNPQGPRLKTFCGSLYFAAPELLHGYPYYGPEVDVWSLGIILYVMLIGRVPFDEKSMHALHAKIKKGHFEIPRGLISLEAEDLLRRIIRVNPQERLTINEIMQHPWMQKIKRHRGKPGEFAPYLNHSGDMMLDQMTVMRQQESLSLDEGIISRLVQDFELIGQFPIEHRPDSSTVKNTLDMAIQEGTLWTSENPVCRLYRLALLRYSHQGSDVIMQETKRSVSCTPPSMMTSTYAMEHYKRSASYEQQPLIYALPFQTFLFDMNQELRHHEEHQSEKAETTTQSPMSFPFEHSPSSSMSHMPSASIGNGRKRGIIQRAMEVMRAPFRKRKEELDKGQADSSSTRRSIDMNDSLDTTMTMTADSEGDSKRFPSPGAMIIPSNLGHHRDNRQYTPQPTMNAIGLTPPDTPSSNQKCRIQ